MLKKITIDNFKSIDSISIEFKNFNLLCGENASGKTTVIHSILAAIQSHKDAQNFDGAILKIGDLSELKRYGSAESVSIKIEDENGNSKRVVLKRNEDVSQDKKDLLIIEPNDSPLELNFEEELFYLSSIRNGVMEIYSKGDYSFGVDGSSAISYLFEHQDDLMNSSYMEAFKEKFPDSVCKENPKFIEHVRFWLKHITAEEVNIDAVPYTNQYVLTFGNENKIRPINTGSGYSFVLPILVTCLGAINITENSIVIIENPEIYLHPEAQILLVSFFEFLSNFTQFIIETHSEYILKRAMEVSDFSRQILVFKKVNKITQYSVLNGTSFKTYPISYPEVLYKAFNICSVELHIILFSKLQVRSGAKTIKAFDKWLLNHYPSIPQKCRVFENIVTKSLPVYIRNTIDHPEGLNTTTNSPYTYTQNELKQSVDSMLNIL